MKKTILMLGLVLLLICDGVYAQSIHDTRGSIGLFTDSNHSNWCVYSDGSFFPFEMWVWCCPGSTWFDGLSGAEFRIFYGSGIIASTTTQNPDIAVSLGDLPSGLTISFGSCQYDWAWIAHQTLFVASTASTYLEIQPTSSVWGLVLAPCPAQIGYPPMPATVLSKIYVNSCGPLATERTSWGAIKELF